MNIHMNKRNILVILFTLVVLVAGCTTNADVASRNLSYQADNFQVMRRIVFYNGITDSYIMTIEGLCSLGNNDASNRLTVTCKTGQNEFKKHFLGLSDNVTFFAEQIDNVDVSTQRYKVVFKPSVILPDIDLQ